LRREFAQPYRDPNEIVSSQLYVALTDGAAGSCRNCGLIHSKFCVKSLAMRKWMRERLQRRKKKATEPSDQPSPPPLQPAYFDAEPKSGQPGEDGKTEPETGSQFEPPEEQSSPGADSISEAGAENSPEEEVAETPAHAKGPAPINRGRRRRGGRGRGGRGREQAVAQAFAPAAAKGSGAIAPAESPAESGDPEISDAAESEGESPAAPIPAPDIQPTPASAPRPPKGIVVLAIGLPGSGKSSWFKRHSIVPLSSDMMRSLLFDNVREQRYQDLVFSNLRSLLKARLIAKRPMNYVDATNLTPKEREHWIKLAKDYNYEVHAVFFDVPLEVCVERHHRRDRVVPEDVMRRMAAKLKPPTFEEGFAKITVVRVKKKEEK
jgi:predicted kinase